MTPLPPIDTAEQRLELAHSNRRVLAAHLRWPAGHLDVCEQVDADHPGWFTTWSRENPGRAPFAHPAQFSAFRRHGGIRVHAETAEGLRAAIGEAEVRVAEEAERAERSRW